ncbi:MAG TPA: copper transporter [Micromonospora sp.]|nr:copper transporter [Micromonospora sp.]
MINFRYHVVSLTAVFLSLAIGLVVGTAALNGPVADSLKEQVNGLRKHNEQLREQVNSLTDEVNREEDYVIAAAPLLLDNVLANHRIIVITLPSGRDHVDGVVERLRMASASVTGRIDFQDKFVEPDHDSDLMSLAESAAQQTVPTDGLPGNSNGVETSSALLASALLDRPEGATVAEADRKAVLDAYADAGYLSVADNKISGPAEAVVVVSGQSYVDRNAAQKDAAVVTMVSQFDKVAPLTVAGSGTSSGNVVSTVRGDPALSKTVSTVDNANTPMGQVCTALATAEQIKPKKTGHYGLGDGAIDLLPKPIK